MRLTNRIWSWGAAVRDFGRKVGLPGPIQSAMLRLAPKLVPPPTSETVATLENGLALRVPPRYPSARTYAIGKYEPEVTDLVRTTLSQGDIFVDVGANVGYFTLVASTLVGETGHIFSFEPEATSFEFLMRNLRDNKCRNVTAENMAVADRERPLTKSSEAAGPETTFSSADLGAAGVVEGISLDSYFSKKGWPKIRLIKIDVEGWENHVLAGMAELCRRNPRLSVILEFNEAALRLQGTSRMQLCSTLRILGFDRAFVIERNRRVIDLGKGLPGTGATYNLLLERR